MSRLSWVQSPDLLTHELVASAHEGKPIEDVVARWQAAGGQVDAPVAGLAQEGDEDLRRLAEELLDDLESRPVAPDIAAAEPDDLEAIEAVSPGMAGGPAAAATGDLPDRVLGAWSGRAAGCLLGKPVEKIPREGIREILTSQGRWPLDDWFTEIGLSAEIAQKWPWNRRSRPTSLAENIAGMPEDDDLNFPMLGLALLEQHGHDFTTADVADLWLANLPGGRVFTAERVAYRNLLLGDSAPRTATRRNPYREWIGALIRADVYGWACPGDPVAAARLAWTDARLSHVRNGVYGAMSAAAMCSQALVATDIEEVLAAGLAVVPPHSRYAEALAFGADVGRSGDPLDVALDRLHERYGHLHWVHVLNNAAITSYALASSKGDFTDAICTAVMGGWDTDSVGATVGSITGALAGASALPQRWIGPMQNRVATSMPGFDGISFDELARRTLAVIAR